MPDIVRDYADDSEKMVVSQENHEHCSDSGDLIDLDKWYKEEQSMNLQKSPNKSVRFDQSCVVDGYSAARQPENLDNMAADRPHSSSTVNTYHTCEEPNDAMDLFVHSKAVDKNTQSPTTNFDQPAAPFSLVDKTEDDWYHGEDHEMRSAEKSEVARDWVDVPSRSARRAYNHDRSDDEKFQEIVYEGKRLVGEVMKRVKKGVVMSVELMNRMGAPQSSSQIAFQRGGRSF